MDALVLTDFGRRVRSQFCTPQLQLLGDDASVPWVVGVMQRGIGGVAARTARFCAYDTLWHDASGLRAAAGPRPAFGSMRAASPRLGVDVRDFFRRRDGSTASCVVLGRFLGETRSNCCPVCSCV